MHILIFISDFTTLRRPSEVVESSSIYKALFDLAFYQNTQQALRTLPHPNKLPGAPLVSGRRQRTSLEPLLVISSWGFATHSKFLHRTKPFARLHLQSFSQRPLEEIDLELPCCTTFRSKLVRYIRTRYLLHRLFCIINVSEVP